MLRLPRGRLPDGDTSHGEIDMNRCEKIVSAMIALAIAAPATAGDHTVIARNGPGGRHFDPTTLTIAVGDTVTFMNDTADPGFHNVRSDDGALTAFRCADGCDGSGGNGNPSSSLWQATITFPTAGTIGYYCEVHGSSGGNGMAGIITVGDAGGPSVDVSPPALVAATESGASTSTSLSIANSGAADLSWSVDTASEDCATPDNVPWIALSPTSGVVTVGAPAATVDVTLDAAELVPGAYDANVCVSSNDSTNGLVAIPVEFTVAAPDLVFMDGFDG